MRVVETSDRLRIEISHKPEAEHDFVVVRYTPTDGNGGGGVLHLQPREATALARHLLRYANDASVAQRRYQEEEE